MKTRGTVCFRRICAQPDLGWGALVFCAGALLAMGYTATGGGSPQFWRQTTFMQGLWWVCGQGWENPNVFQAPGLEDFLYGRSECFDCGSIPAGVAVLPRDTGGMTFAEINAFHPEPEFAGFLAWQRYHLYLVLAVTAMWWLFGVCWGALLPLSGVLYGATCAMAYGIYRLGLRRPFALLGAALTMTSPLHLQMAPHLRDYAKGPFTLAALLLMGLLVLRAARPRAAIGWSALCGAAIGIGMGFRTDTMIALPAALAVVVLFQPGALRATWRLRLGAAAALLAGFVMAGYPILLETFRESGHFCHVALLGFLDFCNRRLGVHADLYQLGDPFSDFYILSMVQGYAHRLHGQMPPSWVMMPPYHEASQQFFREYVTTFPADLVYRAETAVLRVLDEMHPDRFAPWPHGIEHPALRGLFQARSLLADHLPGGGRYYAALALMLIAAGNLRLAFAALFVLLYFAGYPSIQYNLRHAFHLEIFSVWAALFLAQAAWMVLGAFKGGKLATLASPRAVVRRVGIFVAVSALALWLPLLPLRAYQHARVDKLVAAVESAARTPLAVEPTPLADGLLRLRVDGLDDAAQPEQRGLPLQYAYLALEFAPGTRDERVPVTFSYAAEHKEHWDFTRTLEVALAAGAAGPMRLYFPLYWCKDARFLGIDLPAAQAARLRGVSRVDGAKDIPLWLTLTVPPDWEAMPKHQTRTR